ncbi:MAG: oligosaccharide flippase family protein [Betaproteobacteria bacterium]|nr:oligosaccharide flippase family protein [Betaproteobacteria bacterium]
MFRNIFWMGLSSAVRLCTGLILFVLIARHLGPEEFGHYMFWYGSTFLCALLANYGLSNMLLKEIAQHPENIADVLSESLSLRFTLSAVILLCAMVSSVMVDRPELLLALLLAHLIENISDTFYVTYRAAGYYARESQLAASVAIVQLAFVVVAVLTNQNAAVIAISHLAGKVAQLALILPLSRRVFGVFSLQPVYTSFRLAIRTKSYAIDYFLGSLFGNIDSVILRAYAGIDAVGIYQSGMRIFQGGNQFAPILSNVFLPEIAKQTVYEKKNSRITFTLQVSFLIYGLFFGLALAYFSDRIVNFAFGENYKQLISLFPFFGLLFFIRLFAAAWGVILTATGHQRYRAKSTAIHLVFALSVGSYFTYIMQAKGWLIALILANILLGILYMIRVVQSDTKVSATLGVVTMIVGVLLFVPQLF